MKKNIALIISILTLIFVIYKFQIYTEHDKLSLSGKKINNYIYSYNINTEEKEISDIIINRETIYYLANNQNKYYLYTSNIYQKEFKKINEIKNNALCKLNNNFINCYNENINDIYDLTFTKKHSLKENYNIPYKDTYLKYANNILYLYQNKDIQFRDLNSEYHLEDYIYLKNNTYLLLKDKNKIYYLYDIKGNSFTKIEATNYNIYNNGFYFINENSIIIKDLVNNKTNTYSNNFNINLESVTTINEDTLYAVNSEEKIINIYDFENNNKKYINIENIKDIILNIYIYNNYLYLITNNSETPLYLIDLNKIPKLTSNNDELNPNINEINNISHKYNLNIKIKEDAITDFPDFSAKPMLDENIISNALSKLTKIVSNFNKDFFNNFYLNNMGGLNLYLTSNLTPSNFETQISNPAAYSLILNNKYTIVIDINESNIEELFCHELMHNIEFNLKNKNIEAFKNWQNLNPQDFYYQNSYTKESIYNYTLNETDKNLVYFIDKYSHSYESEDRARIFENICTNNNIIQEYENINKKATYLKEEIINNYPSIKNSNIFKILT